MKKSKFTEQQIAFTLRQAETGTKVKDIIRKLGITEQTFYRWKKQYGGLAPSELKKMKQLEEENRRLKHMVADLSLDKAMLQDVIEKHFEALAEAQSRDLPAAELSSQRASILPHLTVDSIDPSIPIRSYGLRGTEAENSRYRHGPAAVWISSNTHSAAARGLSCQSEARVSNLSRRGPESPSETTASPCHRRSAYRTAGSG